MTGAGHGHAPDGHGQSPPATEAPGGFLVRSALKVAEHDGSAVFRRQPADLLMKQRPEVIELGRCRDRRRRWQCDGSLPRESAHRELAGFDGGPISHAVQPRTKRIAPAQFKRIGPAN